MDPTAWIPRKLPGIVELSWNDTINSILLAVYLSKSFAIIRKIFGKLKLKKRNAKKKKTS